MCLRKCCFCCSLKYGVFTYGVISLAGRIVSALYLYSLLNIENEYLTEAMQAVTFLRDWYIVTIISLFLALYGIAETLRILCVLTFYNYYPRMADGSQSRDFYIAVFSPFIHLIIVTCISLFVALYGITQKKAIYLYPHIVVLILEMLSYYSVAIYLIIAKKVWLTLCGVAIHSLISSYFIFCLTSLHQQIKRGAKSGSYQCIPVKVV